MTKKDKDFILKILKNRVYLYNVLNEIPFEINGFDDIAQEHKEYLYRKISRLVRHFKPRIPKATKLSLQIDEAMYSYKNGFIVIMSNTKGKRMTFKVRTNQVFKGNLRINIREDRVIFSRAIDVKKKKLERVNNNELVIGVDKNYINCLDTSTENSYGFDLNKKSTKYYDKIVETNKKRKEYHKKIREINEKCNLMTDEDKKKRDNIIKFNLGKKKKTKILDKYKEEVKKTINSAIDKFIKEEKPTLIVHENLNFQSKKKKFNKRVRGLLNTWTKGYIQTRLEYKANIYDIKLVAVNAAYTSQECPLCHHFGEKHNDIFYCENELCSANGGVHSGHYAAKVVLQRNYDTDITLWTKYYKVKNIIKTRLCDNNYYEPTQPRPGVNIRSELC
jgi:IS605 OrfB family transposase